MIYLHILYVFLTIFFILFSSFFVIAEFSIVKVRQSRIEQLIIEGDKRAVYVKKILGNLNEYLSTAQVGITLASLALGWLGEPTFEKLLEPVFGLFHLPENVVNTLSFIASFSIITYLHVVLGELAPKTIAIIKAESISLKVAKPLLFFDKILYPFVWLLNESANVLVRLLGFKAVNDHEYVHSEEELKQILSESYQRGKINQSEYHYVNNIFEFDNRLAKEILVPRTEMVCLYKNLSLEENLKIILEEKFTRFPMVMNDKDQILGVVNTKELILDFMKKDEINIEDYIHPTLMVIDNTPVNKLLKRMQKERIQMAILLDEYGGTAGLITIEDILEEIVGEIRDEFDLDERPMIEKLNDHEYLVEGKVLIEDINELFDLDIDDDEIDTIGGWIYSRVPDVNEGLKVDYNHVSFVVKTMDNFRIDHILVKRMMDKE